MFLHFGNVMAGLVKGLHLPLVENNPTNMELLNGLFEVGGVGRMAVLHHEELPDLLIEGHARDIQACQLLVGHAFDQVVDLIKLEGIEQLLDERTSGYIEMLSRWGECSASISFKQKRDDQQGQHEKEDPFETK